MLNGQEDRHYVSILTHCMYTYQMNSAISVYLLSISLHHYCRLWSSDTLTCETRCHAAALMCLLANITRLHVVQRFRHLWKSHVFDSGCNLR